METKANMQAERCAELKRTVQTIEEMILTQRREQSFAEDRIRSQENRLAQLGAQIQRTGDPEGFAGQVLEAERELDRAERRKNEAISELRKLEGNLRKVEVEFNSLRCGRERGA